VVDIYINHLSQRHLLKIYPTGVHSCCQDNIKSCFVVLVERSREEANGLHAAVSAAELREGAAGSCMNPLQIRSPTCGSCYCPEANQMMPWVCASTGNSEKVTDIEHI